MKEKLYRILAAAGGAAVSFLTGIPPVFFRKNASSQTFPIKSKSIRFHYMGQKLGMILQSNNYLVIFRVKHFVFIRSVFYGHFSAPSALRSSQNSSLYLLLSVPDLAS